MPVQTLGRYRIDRELGRGAMGQVFLAYDTEIERRVAIKTIQAYAALPSADRSQGRERFLREARAAGKLLHPGIVTVFDVGEADGVPYLAMEYVEGATLDAFCREDDLLPVPTVVALIAHAAEALAFAHARGIVHRDIKPANLMRVGETSVKIMDFGLAKSAAAQMTNDGALLGTPNYMAPEQVRGDAVDGRADLFSLAVVLYEMLTGTKPFAGDSVSSVLYRIVNERPAEPTLHLDRLAPGLAAFLEKALAKRREDRYADGVAFAAALRRASLAGARQAPPARRGAPAPRVAPGGADDRRVPNAPRTVARGRSPLPYVLTAAALVALASGAVIWKQRGEAPAPVTMREARVRTEPPGLPILLDGAALSGPTATFPAEGPFGLLTAAQGCREARHRLEAADAGTEIVLVVDPIRADVTVDPGVAGAKASANGDAARGLPASFDLDLCRENRIVVTADGYRDGAIAVPARATPLEARNAAASLRLEAIPTGRLVIPATRIPLRLTVDGAPVSRLRGAVVLPAGSHTIRGESDEHFLVVETTADVPADGSATASLAVPPLAALVVQTFPPDASAELSRAGGPWRAIGETPLRVEVAPGAYALRVVGRGGVEAREERIVLRPGANPPVRISFGRR